MSLDLPELLPQVQQLSQSVQTQQSRRAEQLQAALAAYRSLLELPPDELHHRLTQAGSRWTGARPSHDALDESFPPPPSTPGLYVIGADGSQIYPDRHAAAFFFLVNLAGICLQHGSESAPRTQTSTRLYFEPEQLRYESDLPVESAWVNLQRDLGEMSMLADLAEGALEGHGLALLDNSLLLWMLLQARGAGERELDRVLKAYLDAMRRLQASGAALAGIVDRPRSSNVLALAGLASPSAEGMETEETQRPPFPGLTDLDLYLQLLPEGSRSPCFELVSPLNRDFSTAGQAVHFFYLHIANEQLLRVEVPDWVASDRALLDRVHAGLLREGQSTGGYPYVLVRAHELAVVTQAERSLVEEWIGRELSARGIPPARSRKSQAKTLTSGVGRRR